MKFVESFKKDDFVKPSTEINIDKLGNETDNAKEQIFARVLAIDLGNNVVQNKYFLRTHNNVPYDPNGPYSHRETYLKTELKTVSKQTFDYYVMYLKTKNPIYMTRAQRSFING